MADEMFKRDIKSFMADTKITQEEWDKIFGKKDESDHAVKQGETFERWWETITNEMADDGIIPENSNIIRRVPKK